MDGQFEPPVTSAPTSPPDDAPSPAPVDKSMRLSFHYDAFVFLGPFLAALNPQDRVSLEIGPEALRISFGTGEMPFAAVVHYVRTSHPPVNASSAEDKPPAKTVQLEVPASVIRFAANPQFEPRRRIKSRPEQLEPWQEQRPDLRFFQQHWMIDAQRETGSIELPMLGASGTFRFGTTPPNLLRAQVPETTGEAFKIDPVALREALRVTVPFTSDDVLATARVLPIEVNAGIAIATDRKVVARFTHKGLNACHFRIDQKHARKLTRLLPAFSRDDTIIYDEQGFIVIADQHLRAAFRPSAHTVPFSGWEHYKPDYVFLLGKEYIAEFVSTARLLAKEPGIADSLQIHLALGFDKEKEVLKASAQWGREEIKTSGIEVYQARPSVDLNLAALCDAAMASSQTTTNATTADQHDPAPTESAKAQLDWPLTTEARAAAPVSLGYYAYRDLTTVLESLAPGKAAIGVFKRGAIMFRQPKAFWEKNNSDHNDGAQETAFLLTAQKKNFTHGVRSRRRR